MLNPIRSVSLACLLPLIVACADNDAVQPQPSDEVTAPTRNPGGKSGTAVKGCLCVTPRYVLGANQLPPLPVNRVRAVVRNASTHTIVATLTANVDPGQMSWVLSLETAVTEPTWVVVGLDLLNVQNGIESLQWRGTSDPVIVPRTSTEPVVIRVSRPEPGK